MEESSDPKRFDTAMKQLSGNNPQAWVSFLLRGNAVYQEDLNRELKTRTIIADTLYKVVWDGEPIILHIEFQRDRDDNMPLRVWEYNVLTRINAKKPVYSVVIYPVEIPSITASEYMLDFQNGRQVGWFSFDQIKLWEIEPEVFEDPQFQGLLPILALTKGGQNRETVERMLHDMELAGMGKEDFLIAEIVTGLVLKSEQDKEWLKARFQVMSNILKESWVYQEILQEGKQKGIEQGIKQEKEQDILRFVELRFSSLLAQAKQTIERQLSFQQLQALQDRLYLATTIDEVLAALQEVGRDG